MTFHIWWRRDAWNPGFRWAVQQSRTCVSLSWGSGWLLAGLKETFKWELTSPLRSPLFSPFSHKRFLVTVYFLCYFEHRRLLWQNYGLILSGSGSQSSSKPVCDHRNRGQSQAMRLVPSKCVFWNFHHAVPRGLWVKNGRRERVFSNFRLDCVFHPYLDWKRDLRKKEEKVYPGKQWKI